LRQHADDGSHFYSFRACAKDRKDFQIFLANKNVYLFHSISDMMDISNEQKAVYMKRTIKKILLLCFLLSFALTACDAKFSCVLQAVAGGSQTCQETAKK